MASDTQTKLLLLVISILLSGIAAGVGWTFKTVYYLDKTVVAMKQHLVDGGWNPVALGPKSKSEKEAGPVPAKAAK